MSGSTTDPVKIWFFIVLGLLVVSGAYLVYLTIGGGAS